MATFYKFYSYIEDLHEKVHNLGSDTLKFLLTNDAPNQTTWAQLSNVTGQLSTGSGYTSGGATLTITSSAQSAGLYTLMASDLSWTASGGSIGPFRYAVLYNDTSTNDRLIGWIDYSFSITVASGQTFTIDLDQVTGFYYAS
jgi:hypothetical protein